jgi:hypothetical protein
LKGLIQGSIGLKKLFVVIADARGTSGSIRWGEEESALPSGNLAIRSVHKVLVEAILLPRFRDLLVERPGAVERRPVTDKILTNVLKDLDSDKPEAYSFSFVHRRIACAITDETTKLQKEYMSTMDSDDLFLSKVGLTKNVANNIPDMVASVYRYNTVAVGLGFNEGSITEYVLGPSDLSSVSKVAGSIAKIINIKMEQLRAP